MNKQQTILLSDAFKSFITASASGKRKMTSGKIISEGVIQNYRHFHSLLQDYETASSTKYRILIFRKMSQTLAKTEQRYWKKFFEGFSKYLYQQKGYYDNLVANCFKTIKTVFNFLRVDRSLIVGEFYKQFRIPSQQPVPISFSALSLPQSGKRCLLSSCSFHVVYLFQQR